MAVRAPREVIEGLEAVRQSGNTNMLDRRAVQYWAAKFGSHATVVWLEDHKREYALGIFGGFEADEEADSGG